MYERLKRVEETWLDGGCNAYIFLFKSSNQKQCLQDSDINLSTVQAVTGTEIFFGIFYFGECLEEVAMVLNDPLKELGETLLNASSTPLTAANPINAALNRGNSWSMTTFGQLTATYSKCISMKDQRPTQ
ncbi:hypothetical protein SCA6_012416 [Theobroma cacao]